MSDEINPVKTYTWGGSVIKYQKLTGAEAEACKKLLEANPSEANPSEPLTFKFNFSPELIYHQLPYGIGASIKLIIESKYRGDELGDLKEALECFNEFKRNERQDRKAYDMLRDGSLLFKLIKATEDPILTLRRDEWDITVDVDKSRKPRRKVESFRTKNSYDTWCYNITQNIKARIYQLENEQSN